MKKLLDAVAGLGEVEIDMLCRIAARLQKGRAQYGDFVSPLKEDRELIKEGLEEIQDTLVYIEGRLMQIDAVASLRCEQCNKYKEHGFTGTPYCVQHDRYITSGDSNPPTWCSKKI